MDNLESLINEVKRYCASFSGYGHPRRIIIKFADGEKLQIPITPTLNAGREWTPDELESDIIETLQGAGERLTTMQLLSAMERGGRIHGESTVRGRLRLMVKSGVLTNDQSAKPPGYAVA